MAQMISNFSLTWLCLIALFAFIELFFLYYRVIWFSVGATAGLLVSLFSGPFWLQLSAAVTVAGLLLWFSRGWVKQVRCEDALQEICAEEKEPATGVARFNQGIKDFEKNSTAFDVVSCEDSLCRSFPQGDKDGGEKSLYESRISIS